MNQPGDDSHPVEHLLAADTPPPLSQAVQAAHKAHLRAVIAADLAAPGPRPTGRHARGIRRWVAALVGAASLIATGGVAVAFLPHAQPQQYDLVRCFSNARPPFTESPDNSSATLTQGGTLQDTAHEAINLCAQAWADGWLPDPSTKDPDTPPPGNQPVPELQACVLPDGVVGVFPGDPSVCLRLGLPASLA